MERITIELTDGSNVELEEAWVCADGYKDAHSEVYIFDKPTGMFIGFYEGTLPDMDDEDFSMTDLVNKVETELYFV